MEASPLTQQARPRSFQPKIANLYENLFKNEDDAVHPEGFWSEFFLLKPDIPSLRRLFENLSSDDLLQYQAETQQLFSRAVNQIKIASPPADENALNTLTVLLGVILSKRYASPSADIIAVLAGLDRVDAIFLEFANAIENIVRTGRSVDVRLKAIQVVLSLTAGAYQTSLISYFTHRDLFPALMKEPVVLWLPGDGHHRIWIALAFVDKNYIQDNDQSRTFEPFLLLGLLANYNKFEFRNPYRIRLEDFVNETVIEKVVRGLGQTCSQLRDDYVALLEDVNEGWSLSSALNYIGLGILAPAKALASTAHVDDAKHFAALPKPSAAVLLSSYDFGSANKLFCFSLVSCPSLTKNQDSPFGAFLSLTSYILHHAYRSSRATLYGLLNLSILRLMIEDPTLCKKICEPTAVLAVRLCRQRQPLLPSNPTPRPPAASILDIVIDTINHNLRRRLDMPLYIACISLIHQLISYLVSTRTRFKYHWSLLWQTLLSFLRFLTTYAASYSSQDPDLPALLAPFLATLALTASAGDAFLPDPAAYDDFFYKLVEAGRYLPRFKEAFKLHPDVNSNSNSSASTSTSTYPNPASNPAPSGLPSHIDLLIHVSTHFHDLLEAERSKGRMGKTLSPREVNHVIRIGYDTLQIPPTEDLDRWPRFREADEKSLLKRAARAACEDTRRLLKG